MECINLLNEFGKRFRITFDPAYDPKHRPRDKLNPWYTQIPCLRGTIYPFGGTTLAVEVDGRPITAGRLSDLGCCELHQDGDNEKTFLFDVADFRAVARIVKPRRRRRLTEAQRQNAADRLRKYQFQSRTSERSRRPVTQAEATGR